MKPDRTLRSLGILALTLLMTGLLAGPALAVTYVLRAAPTTVNMPDGAAVTMWGFADDTNGPGTVTVPGPRLVVPPGDTTLTIQLINNLPQPISLVIPGQPGSLAPKTFLDKKSRARVRSFNKETAIGKSRFYIWKNLKPGTYIYHSGTRPAVQVQMGLYGAVTADAADGQAYAGLPYDNEVLLFFSEIDPALHNAVATGAYGKRAYRNAVDYQPKYFLVNGSPYPGAAPVQQAPLRAGQRILTRFFNMGLRDLVPTINGLDWEIVAEDGNPLAHAKTQYSLLLPAGKTYDAILRPAAAGSYAVFDRRLSLTNNATSPGGMLLKLPVLN